MKNIVRKTFEQKPQMRGKPVSKCFTLNSKGPGCGKVAVGCQPKEDVTDWLGEWWGEMGSPTLPSQLCHHTCQCHHQCQRHHRRHRHHNHLSDRACQSARARSIACTCASKEVGAGKVGSGRKPSGSRSSSTRQSFRPST